MAKIKTRETQRGSIKTIDRASIMTEHIRQASFKVKDSSVPGTRDSDSPDSYAQDRISETGHAAADRAVIASGSIGKSAARQIRMKKDAIEIKKRKDELLKSRNAKAAEQAAELGFHSAKVKTSAEMQKRKAASRKTMADKAKRDAAIRNSIKLRDSARRVRKDAKRSVQAMSRLVRRIIEGARAMAMAIGAAGTAAIVIVVMCVLFGAAFYFFGDDSSSYEPVSPEVEAYTPLIQKYANEYGIPQYTELIKAVMMQESGGRGKDPMQASECGYNKKYPKKPNGIKDPEYSIDCGVHYLSDNLSAAKAKSPVDMDRIKLALQGYNYGAGYIPWAMKKYGGYSYSGAVEFSKQQAKKNAWSSYGDPDYVEHVLRYYPYGNYSYDVINTGPGKLGLPIKGMKRGNISSHFGPRSSPGGIGSTYHQGLDIAFPMGTKVLACESGTVTTAGWNGGFGKCIIIDHGGKLQTVYGHLSSISVKSGQKVVRGQYIGNVGSTGQSTGPHLHLGVKMNGKYVNPEKGWLSIP